MADNSTQTIVDCYEIKDLETVSSPYARYFLIFLYTVTALFSLGGNVVVIIVQRYGKRCSTVQYMRKYLINLAVSDIAMGVLCVPFTYTDLVYREWLFPEFLCPITQCVQLLTVFVTAYTLTIIGIERYMATLHPLSGCYKWLQSHGHFLLVSSWLFGAVYAFIPLRHTHTREFQAGNETHYECAYQNGWSKEERSTFMLSNFIITYAVPALILTFAYVQIIRKFRRIHRRHKRQQKSSEALHVQSLSSKQLNINETAPNSTKSNLPLHKRKISSSNAVLRRSALRVDNRALTIRLLIVILMYGLCWTPVKLYQLLANFSVIPYCSETEMYTAIYVYIVCHWCAMANCFVNPIIYSFMCNSFCRDLRRIMQSSLMYIMEHIQLIAGDESTTDAAL